MFEVFFDTVVLCTLTALVILCMTGSSPETIPYEGAALAAWCFSRRLGIVGEYLVSGSMVVFAFATIMAWFYLGRQAAAYFIGGCEVRGKCAEYVCVQGISAFVYCGCIFRKRGQAGTGLAAVGYMERTHGLFPIDSPAVFVQRGDLPEGFFKKAEVMGWQTS